MRPWSSWWTLGSIGEPLPPPSRTLRFPISREIASGVRDAPKHPKHRVSFVFFGVCLERLCVCVCDMCSMNMISLFGLGVLEERLGFWAMLRATVALVALVETAHCLLACLVGADRAQLSVGFSGVLFAWIVVATLHSPRYCLLPGLELSCFTTFQLGVFTTHTHTHTHTHADPRPFSRRPKKEIEHRRMTSFALSWCDRTRRRASGPFHASFGRTSLQGRLLLGLERRDETRETSVYVTETREFKRDFVRQVQI